MLSLNTSPKAPLKKFKADKPLFSMVDFGIFLISEQIRVAVAPCKRADFSIFVRADTLALSRTTMVVTSLPLLTVNLNTSISLPLNSSIALCLDVSISLKSDNVLSFDNVKLSVSRETLFSVTFELFLFAICFFLFSYVLT